MSNPSAAATPDSLQPMKIYPPIEAVVNDTLHPRDMISFISAAINQDGLVGHNIHGYNDLIESGINRIMTQLFDVDRMLRNERTQTEADRRRKSFQVHFQFHDVKVGRPTCTTYLTGQFTDLDPGRARLTGLPYSGPVTLGATATLRAFYDDGHVEERIAEILPFQIGSFPTMVGGINCHTANCPRSGLKEMGEDPTDPGGYFIAKRNEYVVDLLENIRYNSVHLHRQMKANEYVRAEFLSQPGGAFENSSQIRVRFMTSGQITIEINSTKFEKVRLPFYIIYRLFGMTDDKTITETIVFDADDRGPITTHMLDILERAFQLADMTFAPLISELNREKLVQMTAERVAKYLTNPTAYLNNESAIQFLNEDLLGSPTKPGGLDKVLLPHMGQTAESRIRKLRFLGLIIHKMILVHLGVLPSTDRDSYRNKRVHGAGVSLAKAFKTQVNNSIVIPIFRAIKRELKNNPWESITEKTLIDTFRNALTTSDLNRAMEQAITSGNKTIVVRRRAATNRVSSQALERKNVLNTISALRTVVTLNAGNASKATERADMMRRVHPTYTGFICVAQSADTGENVGMRKQLAITTSVCTAGEALPLKLRLLADPAIAALDSVPSRDLLRSKLVRVFINGEWIGTTANAYDLVARYRSLRREGRMVDPFTTIYWDPVTDEVEFWLDVGRLRRPLLIVDSNIIEYDAALHARHTWSKSHDGSTKGAPPRIEFVQNIRFTPMHVRAIIEGQLTLNDLIREGIAEYITPEEQENCLIAESIVALHHNRNNITMQYSHCDIEQSIFGLAAHVSPFGNHTQPARVTYETNQGRQTGGWYVLNFPFRTDKNRFFQFYNEIPLVRTFTHKLVPANGTNVMIAYASYGGNNQEDSTIVCQASVDRGLFAGAFFRFEIAELEKGESFCNPDSLTTKNLKPNACYEKLVDGFIKVGSIARYGDVLIGRVAKLSRGRGAAEDRYQYTDRSIVYRLHEPAVIEAVLRPRGANDELFGLVKIRYERPLRTGDKMCLTAKHKILVRYDQESPQWMQIDTFVTDWLDGELATVQVRTPTGWEKPTAAYKYLHCDVYTVIVSTDEGPVILCCGTYNHRLVMIDGTLQEISDIVPGHSQVDGWGKPLLVLSVIRTISATTYCITIPGERFAAKYDNPAKLSHEPLFWSGNSSRSGNKCLNGEHYVFARLRGTLVKWIKISKLIDGDAYIKFEIYGVRGWCEPTEVHRYEDVPTYTVWTTSGNRLCVTSAEHRLPIGETFIQVKDLQGGESVSLFECTSTNVCIDRVTPTLRNETVYCFTVPGDKFVTALPGSVQHWTGNSIVAQMLPQSDMPFTEDGLTPDMIINTHSFPSRMTIGQLIETSLGKICARKGVIADGTAFLPVDHLAIASELKALGFRFNGRERMYNGMTGEYFDAAIFIGPTAEQRLQKFVLDDEQAVGGSGPTDATTGQPLGGKHIQGGIRLGEMEYWGLESHGSMLNLYEKTSLDSDGRKMHVCRGCGSLAVFNGFHNIYQCRACGELADIATVDGSKSAVLLHEELAVANIQVKLGLRSREFESPDV